MISNLISQSNQRSFIRSKLMLIFLLAFQFSVFAQGKRLTGTVSDESGASLPGVNVLIKGTTIGTITDLDGKYSIAANKESDVLTFSFVGYLEQSIPVANKSGINVILKEDVLQLSEVVAIGYGIQKKSDLTGSVTSLKPKDLNTSAVSNAAQMLQGRVTGLYVSSYDQNPGATPEFILRGASSFQSGEAGQPLVVIDGFPMENTSYLNTINPNDIQQIDVLKDASASAIYGSRGANGVVLITTKKGKAGKTVNGER